MLAGLAAFATVSDAIVVPSMSLDYRNRQGLTAMFNGVPLIRGSLIHIVDSTTGKTYFTSTSNDQRVERMADGRIVARFESPNGYATGSQTYIPTEDGFRVEYTFKWAGAGTARAEWSLGQVWARPFMNGRLFLDSTPARDLRTTPFTQYDLEGRKYGPPAKTVLLDSTFGRLHVDGESREWTMFDARGYKEPWANKDDTLWLGQTGVSLLPNRPVTTSATVKFEPTSFVPREVSMAPEAEPLRNAIAPDNRELPIIPSPKQALFDRNSPGFEVKSELRVDVNASNFGMTDELIGALKRRWDVPNLHAVPDQTGNVIVRVQDLGLGPEGYEIRISPTSVLLLGQDYPGLLHACTTVGFLSYAKDGKLWLPPGILRDWPSISWRGVHLFGGPTMREFHSKIGHRVLAPLKFNRIVLQCERTKWDSTPGIETPIFTSKADLKATFEMYRRLHIEPVPLIQSLGHMSWFFENKKNLDLALNPDFPFTIDPRKPGSKLALDKLWAEAIDLLKPRAIHFGLDEIDMRGIRSTPEFTTQLWTTQMPTLNGIAVRHSVTPMIWGDKGLAPGQAIDAALGDNPAEAQKRRAVIPKNAFIGDWHYKNDGNADRYMQSLNLWKREGLTPIGCGWFNGDNIRGFTQACYRAGAGYLQTTWAGYESSEEAMLREYRQFAAYVLAADYAWSGRKEKASELPYDPSDVFARLYFGEPSPLAESNGTGLPGSRIITIGDVTLRRGTIFGLTSLLSPMAAGDPMRITLEPKGLSGRVVTFAVDTVQLCSERDPVAEITVIDEKGKETSRRLVYGPDVRAGTDLRATVGSRNQGLSLIRVPLQSPGKVSKIVLTATSTYAGLRVHGITAY